MLDRYRVGSIPKQRTVKAGATINKNGSENLQRNCTENSQSFKQWKLTYGQSLKGAPDYGKSRVKFVYKNSFFTIRDVYKRQNEYTASRFIFV